jgi:hypothetical protein
MPRFLRAQERDSLPRVAEHRAPARRAGANQPPQPRPLAGERGGLSAPGSFRRPGCGTVQGGSAALPPRARAGAGRGELDRAPCVRPRPPRRGPSWRPRRTPCCSAERGELLRVWPGLAGGELWGAPESAAARGPLAAAAAVVAGGVTLACWGTWFRKGVGLSEGSLRAHARNNGREERRMEPRARTRERGHEVRAWRRRGMGLGIKKVPAWMPAGSGRWRPETGGSMLAGRQAPAQCVRNQTGMRGVGALLPGRLGRGVGRGEGRGGARGRGEWQRQRRRKARAKSVG